MHCFCNSKTIFLVKKPTFMWVKTSEKNTFSPVWDLATAGKEIEKAYFAAKNNFRTAKDMTIGTACT